MRLLMKVIGYVVLVLLLVLAVGLFSIDYSAGVALLIGIVLSLPTRAIWKIIASRIPKLLWRERFCVIHIFQLLVIIFSVVVCAQFTPQYLSIPHFPPPCAVLIYRVVVEVSNPTLENFTIREDVVFSADITNDAKFSPNTAWTAADTDEGRMFRLPTKQATGTSLGFIVMGVRFEPSRDMFSSASFPNLYGFNRSLSCSRAMVEVRDFPKGSFYAAKEADDLKVYPYVGTETVTWLAHNLDERAIEFAYIPPPYYHLRPLLAPLTGLSSLSQWVVGLIGVLVAVIITPVVRPVLTGITQEKLKSWLDRGAKKQSAKRASLIVSSDGTKKEIEVRESKGKAK